MLADQLSFTFDVFKTRSPALLGVDIASTSIKMVELADAGKGLYRLERYVIEPIPRDVVTDGNVVNVELAGDALKRAWKRLGSRHRNVALALPAAMVITKKIIVAAGSARRTSSSPSRPRPINISRSRSMRSISISRSWGPRPTTPTKSRC